MGIITYGTEKIPGVLRVESTPKPQNAIQTSLSREGSRVNRLGIRQAEIRSFHRGLGILHAEETDENLERLHYSEGLWSHIPHGLYLPPILTTEVVDSGHNISGYRAANKGANYVISTLGQSNPRLYVVVGNELYRATSDSDESLASAHSWTDPAYFAAELVCNNTRYLATGGGGDTNDIFGIADPVGDPTTTASLITLSSGDWVGAAAYMRVGGPEFNLFYGKIGGVSGLWFLLPNEALLTVPKPLVLADTKGEIGNIASVTQSEILPSAGSNEGLGTQTWGLDDASQTQITSGIWLTPGNITAEDTSYAQYQAISSDTGTDNNEKAGQTSWLNAFFNAASIFPAANYLVGAAIRARVKTTDGGDGSIEARLAETNLTVNGSTVGAPRSVGTSIGTTEENNSMGSSSDAWQALITGEDAARLGARMRFGLVLGPGANSTTHSVDVDTIGLTITTAPLGDQAYIPLGGRNVGIDPFNPSHWYILAPLIQDDATGHTVPRVLWKIEVEWDTAQERPVCTPTVVATGLNNVECAAFDDEGYLWVAGDNSTGIGKAVKRLDKNGGITDMGLFADEGLGEDWGVVNLVGSGGNCVAELALEDATVLQSWICTSPGVWSPISKRLTIDTLPLRVAGPSVDPHQHYRHRIYETVAGTGLSDSFQYHPINFMLNPLDHLDGVDKEDGYLVIETPHWELLGPPEALKTMLVLQCNSHEISASKTVRIGYRLGHSGSFTNIATFTATGTRTAITPVKFSALQFEVGLDRGATATDTPNGLSFLIEGTSRWPALRKVTAYIDPGDEAFRRKYGVDGMEKLISNLQTQQATTPIATLQPAAALSFPADWIDYGTEYQGVESASRGVTHLGELHKLVWEEVVSS